MRVIGRILLGIVFVSSVVLVGLLLRGPKQPETWATITALLAVVAAVVSAWPSLRVLEIQEDAMRPCPTPYFDATSRYGLLLLRVKNLGAGVAYGVKLKWKNRPLNSEGKEITQLDEINLLMPQESVSVLVGGIEIFKMYPSMRFDGEVEFRNVNGKRMKEKFVCSADEHRFRLLHDDELPRTLYDLQKLPAELADISRAIREGISSSQVASREGKSVMAGTE